MRNSIRSRIVLSHMLITLFTVAMIGFLGLVLLLQHGLQREERYLRANAEAIALQVEPFLAMGVPASRVAELARTSAFLIDARVQVLDASGEALADSGAGRVGEELIWIGPGSAAMLPRSSLGMAEGANGGPASDDGPLVIGIRSDAPEGIGSSIEEQVEAILEARVAGEGEDENAFLEEGALFVRRMGSHLDGRIEFHREQIGEREHWTKDAVDLGSDRIEEVIRIEDPEGFHELRFEAEGPAASEMASSALASAAVDAESEDGSGSPRRGSLRIEVLRTPEKGPSAGASAVSRPSARTDGRVHAFSAHLHAMAGGLHGRSRRGVAVPVGTASAPMGWVEVSQGPSFQGETLAAAARAFGLAALVASVLAGMVGLVFSRGMTAPLARLTEATDRMGAGDLAARAPVDGRDEIASLAEQFNRMAAQLESSFEALEAERDALRHFIADASHELRTPITALKNFNSLLQGPAAGDTAAREEFLREGAKQIERLEWMTQHLLDLSRLEAGLIELEREPIPVSALIDGAMRPLEHRFEGRNMRLELDALDRELVIDGDGQRLQMVVKNLAENALKYGRDGGSVEVVADGDDAGCVTIRVCDDGRGVPEDERERIFERFYRASNAGEEAGDGLGLAIARSIVRAHGGELRCEPRDAGGACFVMRLPAGEAAAGDRFGS